MDEPTTTKTTTKNDPSLKDTWQLWQVGEGELANNNKK
jgi:hypothetical protein